MEALIPDKDSLLKIIQLQKKILQQIQDKNTEAVLSPVFPLFVFSQKFDRNILNVKLEKAYFDSEEKTFSFKIKIENKNGVENFRINFGKIISGTITDTSIVNNNFSEMNLKIFRLATVIFENNTWQVFDEKWIKLK